MSSVDDIPLSDPAVVAQLRTYTLQNPDTPAARYYCLNFPSDDAACWDNDVSSFWDYRPSVSANTAFLILFAFSLLGFLGVLLASVRIRRWRGTVVFSASLAVGVLLELMGYAGRLGCQTNPWQESPFLLQITALTLGPAFMAASLYLCLRRVVQAYGPENSRIRPEYYTRIFIPCDVLSLVLQAIGGGIAAVNLHQSKSIDAGNNIMIAGLVFQCVTLFVFIVAALDFSLRVYRRGVLDQDPVLVRLRSSFRFRAFVGAVSLATVLILWRSIFRAAELAQGWSGPIIGNEGLFIAFEGVLILVAVFTLNAAHPAWCAPELFGGLGSKRRTAAEGVVGNGDVDLTLATPASESRSGLWVVENKY